MKKTLGHIGIFIGWALLVYGFNSFVVGDFNPFHYSLNARVGMVVFFIFPQLFMQIGYSAFVYNP